MIAAPPGLTLSTTERPTPDKRHRPAPTLTVERGPAHPIAAGVTLEPAEPPDYWTCVPTVASATVNLLGYLHPPKRGDVPVIVVQCYGRDVADMMKLLTPWLIAYDERE